MKDTKNIYANYINKQDISSRSHVDSQIENNSKDTPVLAVFERLEEEGKIKKERKKRDKKRGLSLFHVFIILFIVIFGIMQAPSLLYSFAERLYSQGRYDEAMSLYDKAAIVGSKIGQEEYSTMSNRVIADYYYDCGEYEEAAKRYEMMIDQVDVERINEIASQYYNSEDYENAIKWYEFSGNSEGILNTKKKIASQYYENKEYEEAARCYEEIGDEDSYKKAAEAMAFSCYSDGKYEEAIEWYEKIENTSGVHMAQIKLAKQCLEVGDYEGAIEYYESAGEEERVLEVKKLMADQYYENGEYKQAEALYEGLLQNELPFTTRLEIMVKKGRCKMEQ